jgi:small subunit ribosomal protein S6
MKKYEIMTIASSKLSEERARSLSNFVKDLISTNGGTILNSNFWGKRKFAYEVKGQTEGWYDVIEFNGDESGISKLKQKLNITDDLVRYLIILVSPRLADGGKDGKKSK